MLAALYVMAIGVPVGDGIYAWTVIEAPIYFSIGTYLLLRVMWSQGKYVE